VYTRPPVWRDLAVPEVLLSGHHGRISRWRRDRALERTARRRPDLLTRLDPRLLDRNDREMLSVLGWVAADDGVVPAEPEIVRGTPGVAD